MGQIRQSDLLGLSSLKRCGVEADVSALGRLLLKNL
jgi:hypothetical protein